MHNAQQEEESGRRPESTENRSIIIVRQTNKKTKDKESLEKFREKFKTEGRLTPSNQNQEDRMDPESPAQRF